MDSHDDQAGKAPPIADSATPRVDFGPNYKIAILWRKMVAAVTDYVRGMNVDGQIRAPAPSADAPVKWGHVICGDCGKQVRQLERHLAAQHGSTLEDYRARSQKS